MVSDNTSQTSLAVNPTVPKSTSVTRTPILVNIILFQSLF